MEPENTPLEEENHRPNHHFQVRFDDFRWCKKNARLLLRLQLGHLHPSLNDVQIESTLVNMGG